MGLKRGYSIFFCAAVMLVGAARAQDTGMPNEAVVLPCEDRCPTIINPVKISGENPPFPEGLAWRSAEGIVDLQFIVGVDGRVGSDLTVLRAMAAPEFVESAKRTVRDWVFRPATIDGKPVAVPWKFRTVFRLGDNLRLVRDPVAVSLNSAKAMMEDRKADEAKQILLKHIGEPVLNFSERGMLANLLTIIAMEQGKYSEARRWSEVPKNFPYGTLPVEVRRNLNHSNISAALNLGDLAGAAKSLYLYGAIADFDPADPFVQKTREILLTATANPSYRSSAVIPDASEADGYHFYLSRRSFTFTNIVGKLDSYHLYCKERGGKSAISEKAEWSVPKNWSDCSVIVHGQPGTTFDIVQFASTQAAK